MRIRFNIILLIVSVLTTPMLTKAQIVINELVASNQSLIFDDFFEFEDWVEIYNTGAILDLAGYYLSDQADSLNKWQFPTTNPGLTTILPGNYLLIWADNDSIQGENHTNFKLSADGEGVFLTAPDGITIIDSLSFPTQQTDISYGRECDGCDNWIYFDIPTPEAPNIVDSLPTPLLYINEVLVENNNNVLDEFFESEPWVEVYNPNPFQVNLASYTFSTSSGQTYTLPNNMPWQTTISANGFLLFWIDGEPIEGALHLGFLPDVSATDITLIGADGMVAATEFQYEIGSVNSSWGRQTDGSLLNQWFNIPTPRVTNSLFIIPPENLSINEVQTSNTTDTIDGSGIHEDWFEITNNGTYPVDLAGYYLTDNLNIPTKWRVPEGFSDSTIIQPGGFLLFWADEDHSQGWNHTNFKLSGSGEVLVLRSIDGFSIADSVHFGAISVNSSWGRDPDGWGPWRIFPTTATTPELCNVCPTLVSEENGGYYSSIYAYPNPVKTGQSIFVSTPSLLLDLRGRVMDTFLSGFQYISVPTGLYFLKAIDENIARNGTLKLVVVE